MEAITTKDIITYALSGGALLVSACALIASIRLPLYLAKRAEERATLDKSKNKLPPFFRKVKEFAVHFNTPGIGYRIEDVYYLSNDASELGLTNFQSKLLGLYHDLEKYHSTPSEKQGKYNEKSEYEVDPAHAVLGKEIQRKLSIIHNMAESENDWLHDLK